MVLNCDIPEGNPNDADMFLETIESLGKLYSVIPKKTSCDGGFSSKENVEKSKESGVKDVCFPKNVTWKLQKWLRAIGFTRNS